MPIGIPGWPELARCTPSMERPRMVLAMSVWESTVSVMPAGYPAPQVEPGVPQPCGSGPSRAPTQASILSMTAC
jgi:hypothetical protein